MTPQQIHEGNQLIAEFMGAETINSYGILVAKHPLTRLTAEVAYYASWDWLMPVVEKIQHLKEYNPDGRTLRLMSNITIDIEQCGYNRKCRCSIIGHIVHCHTLSRPHTYDRVDLPSIWVSGKDKAIEAVWEAIVQFLQWYYANAQPQ